MKLFRIFLLVVILSGLGFLATQKYWVTSLVDYLMGESTALISSTSLTPDTASTAATSSPAEAVTDNWTWVDSASSSAGTTFQYPNPFPARYI